MKPLSPQSKKNSMNFKCYTHVPRREEAQDPQCQLLLPLQAGKEKYLFCYFYSCNGLRNWMELIVGDWHNITDKPFLTILPWKKKQRKLSNFNHPIKTWSLPEYKGMTCNRAYQSAYVEQNTDKTKWEHTNLKSLHYGLPSTNTLVVTQLLAR